MADTSFTHPINVAIAADIAHAPFTGRVARAVAADEVRYGDKAKLATFIRSPRPAIKPLVRLEVGKLYTLPCGAHPMSFDRSLCVEVVALVGFGLATVEHASHTFEVETRMLED